MGNIIVFSAPSGSGKTTIINRLLEIFPELKFSVSATSRNPRGNEKNGENYYFLSEDEFNKKIENNEFIEWEEVYGGTKYGTLTSEVNRITNKGKVAVFDIDVYGALNLKKKYKDAFLIFIAPPSLDELKERLEKRSTDAPDVIAKRLEKAKEEMSQATAFDYILLNDDIEDALLEAQNIISDFLHKKIVPSTFRIVD